MCVCVYIYIIRNLKYELQHSSLQVLIQKTRAAFKNNKKENSNHKGENFT